MIPNIAHQVLNHLPAVLSAWSDSHTCPLDRVVAAARMGSGLAVPVECTMVGSRNFAPVPSDGCQGEGSLDAPYAVVAVAEGDQEGAAVGHCSVVE